MRECESCKNKKNYPCPNSCGYMGVCDGFEPKPLTHADKLRAMSDEELARFMAHYGSVTEIGEQLAYESWLDWLRQEVKDA